jgi:fructokinase
MRIGVDIGGSKIEILALDDAGKVRLQTRRATPHGGYEDARALLVQMIVHAEHEVGEPCTVGIGMPGTLSARTGLVRNAYATPYSGQPLKKDLERLLGREVRIENDANCLALSEACDGASRGARLAFAAVLGTGAGGGFTLDGKLLPSPNGIGGEWGHNPLPWMTRQEFPGFACYCGRAGCIERFISGPGLAQQHVDATKNAMTPAAIVAAAEKGNTDALASLDRHADQVARALAHVINLLDPEVIVVGGGLYRMEHLYKKVPELWKEYVYGGESSARIVPAAHGDASGVRGAARLWD